MDLKGSPCPDPLGFCRSPWKTEMSSLSRGDALMNGRTSGPDGKFLFELL